MEEENKPKEVITEDGFIDKNGVKHVTKGTRGGARPGAGRKSNKEELKMKKNLKKMERSAFEQLEERINNGDMRALELFFKYSYGRPKEMATVTNKQESPIFNLQINNTQEEPKKIDNTVDIDPIFPEEDK